MSSIPEHFQLHANAAADPRASVQTKRARFTVLTPRVIRMEYRASGEFEDRPSQVIWHRRQTVPAFQTGHKAGQTEIITGQLHLRYATDQPFSPETLSLELRDQDIHWTFGMRSQENLGGTARTLDGAFGEISIEEGLLARDGWTVIDDSHSLVFNPQGWLVEREQQPGDLDLYFLGYGADYQAALDDFFRLAGPVPLLPRWALGNWWSRYWAYSEEELSQLMLDFKSHGVPLSVCIIDMDWHLDGWTGYTWNKDLFPEPQRFLSFLSQLGLKKALNLHPADGVGAHEADFAAMCQALELDPSQTKRVPFDLENPAFSKAYFEILHHPQEQSGIDFWWMDWQQGNPVRLKGLNLLWWINHLHFLDKGRPPQSQRPFIFSRWGGLGNHRYPIGFSGDTVVAWESLAFQPYFTATAANVGYGWWSHDIGGHMGGIEDSELYTRWVQFGVFSPIMRLHSTKNPFLERLPWGHDAETYQLTRQAMRMRHALIPYIYSMAWKSHTSGQMLVRPMYHTQPEQDSAYACPNQYWFGSELLVAPFIEPRHAETNLSRALVWLPAGDWYHFFKDEYFAGDAWYSIYGGLNDIPVLARAGAIIPLAPELDWGGIGLPEELTVHIFPGADNHFSLYEDDGETQAYQQGERAETPFDLKWHENQLTFRIGPVQGEPGILPKMRSYTLVFHAIQPAERVTAAIDDAPYHPVVQYAAEQQRLILSGIQMDPGQELVLELGGAVPLAQRNDRRLRAAQDLLRGMRLSSNVKLSLWDNLEKLIADPRNLAAFSAVLSEAHMRMLLEHFSGAGLERIACGSQDALVVWNPRQFDWITLLHASERRRTSPAQRFNFSSEIAPVTKIVQPGNASSRAVSRLQLDYGSLLQIVQQFPA